MPQKPYHELYDNERYRQLQTFLAKDIGLAETPDAEIVWRTMVLVTDSAFECTGDPYYKGAHEKLAIHLAQKNFSEVAAEEVSKYLSNFTDDPYIPYAVKARHLVLVRIEASLSQNGLFDAARESSAIRGWRGFVAHYFVYAARELLRTVSLTLMNQPAGYTIMYAEHALRDVNSGMFYAREGEKEEAGS